MVKRKNTYILFPLCAIVLGLLQSCGHLGVEEINSRRIGDEVDSHFSNISGLDDASDKHRDETKINLSDPPPEVLQSLIPPLKTEFPQDLKDVIQRRFDLSVKDAPISVFLMSLVEGTQINMVVHPAVKGTISLELKNVTITEVLDILRDTYGFEYRKSSAGYEVRAAQIHSKVFYVNYLNVQRSGMSQTKIRSGENNSNAQNSVQSGDAQDAITGSQVKTYSESNFWSELHSALSAILGDKDGRKIVINSHSGMVVVRAMPYELREIEHYLTATQAIIQRQVILEAKILEVELSDGYQSGINWAAVFESGADTALVGQTGGGTVFNGNGVSEIAENSGNLDPDNLSQIVGTNSSAFGGIFSLALNVRNFSAFIEALKTQGDVHVLSSPRISTVNNQKAVIKVGADEFFITDINTEIVSSGNGAVNQSIDMQLTPFFSGVALDVLPQINGNGEVTLYIHPSVSEVSEKVKEIDISTEDTLKVPLALNTIRESDSIVRAASGNVVIIGGLMQKLMKDEQAGVPILSSIPLLGRLFEHERQQLRKSELVILLRPIVIKNSEYWQRYSNNSREDFSEFVTQFGERRDNSESETAKE